VYACISEHTADHAEAALGHSVIGVCCPEPWASWLPTLKTVNICCLCRCVAAGPLLLLVLLLLLVVVLLLLLAHCTCGGTIAGRRLANAFSPALNPRRPLSGR